MLPTPKEVFMITTTIITVLAALIVLVNALLGLRRGTFRSLVRLCLLLISIPVAIGLTRLLSGALDQLLVKVINDLLLSAGLEMTEGLAEASHAIDTLIVMLCAALSFTGTYLFVGLLTKLADKPLAALMEKHIKLPASSRLIGSLLGVAAGLVLVITTICPLTSMLPLANGVAGLIEGEAAAPIRAELATAATSPTQRVISAMGGDAIFGAVTTVTYKDEKVNLRREAEALTDLIEGYVLLSREPSTQWGEEQIRQLNQAADAFDESRVSADLVAAVLCDVGSAWESGNTYMGIPAPSMGELLDPSMQTLFAILADSTGATIRQNIHTAAGVLSAMIEYDVFETMQQQNDSTNAAPGTTAADKMTNLTILTVFSDADFTTRVVNTLYHDAQLRVLIPEVLNLGVRAVALSLGVPDSQSALYHQLIADCRDAFNQTAGQSDVQRMVGMGDRLYDVLRAGGVEVSPSTATALAMGMVADLGAAERVTDEDIRTWFASYAKGEASLTTVASTASNSFLCPLGTADATPALLPLDTVTTVELAGALAAAEYVAATQAAPAPYQIVTVRRDADDAVYWIVSMSDGSLRSFDADGEQVDLGALRVGTLSALDGGEFVAIRCQDGWQMESGPSRIDSQQLSILSSQLLDNLSPLPEGYTPHRTGTTATLHSDRLQNAQNVPTDITDTDTLLDALHIAANHELANGSYTTGSLGTMTDAEQFRSTLPSLDTMLLRDVRAISDGMSESSAESVGDALASLATYLGNSTADPSTLLDGLFTSEGAGTVSALLHSLTELSGDRTAAMNTLLAGVNYTGGDVSALRALLEQEHVVISDVAEHLLTTSGALSALSDADNAEDKIAALQSILSNLTEDGALAIAAAVSPSMLTQIGLPQAHSHSFSSLISSAFRTLAEAKKNGMTDEQFHREAQAVSALFSMSTQIRKNTGGRLFGADGALGMEAQELLDTILSSNIVSDALIDMVGGSSGAYFSIAHANPLSLGELIDEDRDSLLSAIARAEQSLSQLPPSNGELWTPQNNQVTRQDTARRISAFAALFGIEYMCEHVNIND